MLDSICNINAMQDQIVALDCEKVRLLTLASISIELVFGAYPRHQFITLN